jgi:calmodulin-lysine N-methyltransferase
MNKQKNFITTSTATSSLTSLLPLVLKKTENLNINNSDNNNKQKKTTKIYSQQLHWSKQKNFEILNFLTSKKTNFFDIVIACDCLFFEDFHYDLLYTIDFLLHPIDGKAIFFQPRRSNSMQNFIDKCIFFFDFEIF